MTTPSIFQFRVNGGGTYDVLRREDGVYLGRVVKNRRWYNLHPRGLWVTYWTARTPAHTSLKDVDGQAPAHFLTRNEAAEALLKEHDK